MQIEAAADRDGADMHELVQSLGGIQVSEASFKFEEIVEKVQENGLFEWFVPEQSELDSRTRPMLSKLIARYDGRRIGTYRFSVDGKGHARRYRITREAK